MFKCLKRSAAANIVLGPFVDDADGITEETGLTITPSDIRLIKNGSAGGFVDKNDASNATHLENGYYLVNLDATDTDTLGRLRIYSHMSGVMPVWEVFMIIPADVYDSLIGGGNELAVDIARISGSTAALGNFADAYDGTGYDVGGIDVSELNQIVDDLINGGRLDLLIDAIKAKTDQITFTKANEVDANVQSINDAETTGGGTPANPWDGP